MEDIFSQKHMMDTIIDEIKTVLGVETIEDNSPKMPDYPFYTFRSVIAHHGIGFTDMVDHEEFEMTLHFEAHSLSHYEANDLAEKLRKLLQTQRFDLLSAQNNFYIIDCDDIEDTDNFISIQAERRSGFDVNIRAIDGFVDSIDNEN